MAKNSKLPGWPDMMAPPFAGFAGAGASPAGLGNPMAQSLTNGMDFMKNLWGSMPSAVPGFVVPTVDIGELDKRIEDLRAVESWLALNANMLKATIQGLEVQRNTIAALHALRDKGDLFQSAMKSGFAAGKKPEAGAVGEPSPVSDFEQLFGGKSAHANWPLPSQSAAEPGPLPDETPEEVAEPPEPKKHGNKKHRQRAASTRQASPATVSSAGSTAAVQSANMWMNFLKDQFGQIAQAALAPASHGAASTPAASSSAKPFKALAKARRPATKKVARKRAAARTLTR